MVWLIVCNDPERTLYWCYELGEYESEGWRERINPILAGLGVPEDGAGYQSTMSFGEPHPKTMAKATVYWLDGTVTPPGGDE